MNNPHKEFKPRETDSILVYSISHQYNSTGFFFGSFLISAELPTNIGRFCLFQLNVYKRKRQTLPLFRQDTKKQT